jgi:hypothetical protein
MITMDEIVVVAFAVSVMQVSVVVASIFKISDL